MQNRKVGLTVAAVAIAVAVLLFVVLRDDDESSGGATTVAESTTTTTDSTSTGTETTTATETTTSTQSTEPVATIVIKNGEPVGGVQELSFAEGERIEFIVDSDIAEEVHLHGYDVGMDVEAGGKVKFNVPATIPGVFEVELEHSVVPIAEITVE